MHDEMRRRVQSLLGDGYELETELDDAGMSHVFTARDRERGQRFVVKAIECSSATRERLDRFEKEIAVLSTLRHPRIVSMTHQAAGDGIAFYIMKFAGPSLRAKLARSGRLPIAEAAAIMGDVAEGLAVVHAHDIIHRDIKPSNILCGDDGAVITDFGIAKSFLGAQSITREGTGIGTLRYISPEQRAGGAVDSRTDVYSLGVVTYEMLTAHFRTTTLADETRRELRALRQDAPDVLVALIADCLEECSALRPTCEQIGARLRRLAPAVAAPTVIGAVSSFEEYGMRMFSRPGLG
jgi:serine/threonine protein kinase